nr:unnamed protein product [Callosobruchus analis]
MSSRGKLCVNLVRKKCLEEQNPNIDPVSTTPEANVYLGNPGYVEVPLEYFSKQNADTCNNDSDSICSGTTSGGRPDIRSLLLNLTQTPSPNTVQDQHESTEILPATQMLYEDFHEIYLNDSQHNERNRVKKTLLIENTYATLENVCKDNTDYAKSPSCISPQKGADILDRRSAPHLSNKENTGLHTHSESTEFVQILEKSEVAVKTTVNNTDRVLHNFGRINEVRRWTKKNNCPYCFAEVTHFPRHLKRNHADEGVVREILQLNGESQLKRHKRVQLTTMVSNKMREMGRLLIVLRQSVGIKSLFEALKPELFDNILTATKITSGYNKETKNFKAPSLALHMSTSLALKDLNEKQWEKPKVFPLTKDLQQFQKFVMDEANKVTESIKPNERLDVNFRKLTECVMALTLLINRKRIGEVQYLKLKTYSNHEEINYAEEFLESLTENENMLAKHFKRVVTGGKGSKSVAILFPKRIQYFIDVLLTVRSRCVPTSNEYLLANPKTMNRWISGYHTLKKLSSLSGVKNQSLFTSTRLKKQIATVLQVMNVNETEIEQFANFMGHTKKTHEEYL